MPALRRKATLVRSSQNENILAMTDETTPVYLDARLTPSRSLSPTAFLIVMAVVILVSFVAGMAFLSMGAFPVLGFFGLDALLIWFAFRHSFRALNQETCVRVDAEAIALTHRRPGKSPLQLDLPTAFTRVDLLLPERKPSELRLSYRNQTWVIGRFLTPSERRDFKRVLERAVQRARQERYST